MPANAWRKSSYSSSNANCVEVAWRTSSFSTNNANCVEVGFGEAVVGVRDSKNVPGPLLSIPDRNWASFLHTLA